MKLYLSILVALISTASVGLAQAPRAATITGKIHNPPAREITFSYQPPSALGSAEDTGRARQPEPLRLRVAGPRGSLVMGRLQRPTTPHGDGWRGCDLSSWAASLG